jgi:hypothetical protein
MEHLGRLDIASMAGLNFDSSVFTLKFELSISFGSRAAYELARASSLLLDLLKN